jgi:hypothetical protein
LRRAFLLGLLLVACSSEAGGPTPQDGGKTDDGGGSEGAPPPKEAAPLTVASNIVFVDGLVNGVATGVDGKQLELSDVRVCVLSTATSTFMSTHALPYDTAMPLTNYPGLRQGSGMDLGSVPLQVRLDIYSTAGLETDAAWSQTSHTCEAMKCASSGLPCMPHVSFTVSLGVGVNVLALVDDPNSDAGLGVKLVQAVFDDKEYNGGPNALWGTAVDFSDWHNGATVTAVYGNPGLTAGGTPIPTPSPDEIDPDVSTKFDLIGVRFDANGSSVDHFGQTLDSIAYVANPAITPPLFYEVRENFVFALVGDPNDPTAVNDVGGRNPQFNRRGLHIAAVPYATPHETK